MISRAEKIAQVREFCAKPPHVVLFDETGETLFDVRAAKTLALRADELTGVEVLTDATTREPYLRLTYEDGHALALTSAGIAFSPELKNTGPLPELPQAVCFADLRLMLDRVRHALTAHPDEKPSREQVRLIQCGIALVDGAREVGFSVDREERELDELLAQVEQRAQRG